MHLSYVSNQAINHILRPWGANWDFTDKRFSSVNSYCQDTMFVARQDLHVHATPPVESVCCRHPGSLVQLCLDIAPPDQQHTLLHMLSEQALGTRHLEALHHSVHVHIMPCCQRPAPFVPSQCGLRHHQSNPLMATVVSYVNNTAASESTTWLCSVHMVPNRVSLNNNRFSLKVPLNSTKLQGGRCQSFVERPCVLSFHVQLSCSAALH